MSLTPTVDAISRMNFTGHIVPLTWFQHLKMASGKPDSIAILLLADIVFWYRPAEIIDPDTDRVIGYKKKFKADKLQKSYDQFAKEFGFTKDQVRDAIGRLHEKQIIALDFREITTKEGNKLVNVMFIEPIPENLAKITYQERIREGIGIESDTYQERIPHLSGKNPGGIGIESDTNTEITTEKKETHPPCAHARKGNPETEKESSQSVPVQTTPENQDGGRIPNNFTLSADLKSLALTNCPDLDVDLEFRRFCAHARAKGMIALDWEQRFLAWILEDRVRGYKQNRPTSGNSQQQSRSKPVDQVSASSAIKPLDQSVVDNYIAQQNAPRDKLDFKAARARLAQQNAQTTKGKEN